VLILILLPVLLYLYLDFDYLMDLVYLIHFLNLPLLYSLSFYHMDDFLVESSYNWVLSLSMVMAFAMALLLPDCWEWTLLFG
jgi:hypothetical protein